MESLNSKGPKRIPFSTGTKELDLPLEDEVFSLNSKL